jgi:hypothetical protein
MLQQPSIFRWAGIGAALGFGATLFDLVFEWRGPQFYPWVGEGIAFNLASILGSMLGGATLGLIAGAVRNRWARNPEKIF